MRKNLTDRQEKVLDFIVNYIKETGYPPTIREIGDTFGISSKGAYDHLKAIERKGYIKRDASKPRALELMDYISRKVSGPVIDIPIVGKVAAGEPLLANQNLEGTISISSELVKAQEPFALRIKGDSMIEAGILEGDYVIVKQQKSAEQGDIIVALIGDDATVKRFYKAVDHIRLQPANSAMQPIIAKNVTILGKVIGLFREV